MAIYHKHNDRKVKPGDTVTLRSGEVVTVYSIFEYTRGGAGVDAGNRSVGGRWLCSEVGCFHSTGDDEVFNGGK